MTEKSGVRITQMVRNRRILDIPDSANRTACSGYDERSWKVVVVDKFWVSFVLSYVVTVRGFWIMHATVSAYKSSYFCVY
jgi:hypothetical protein